MSNDDFLYSRPIVRLTRPFLKFIRIQSASGLVLATCTLIALVIANTDLYGAYSQFWNFNLKISISNFVLSYPLWYWINDGLMTIFFFVIGLEIKRELVLGELRNPRRVVLPIVAACAGAAVPGLLFYIILGNSPGSSGWAIPIATDIAFVVGALTILGTRIPHGLKVFLLSLAIIDDIIAVIIIALFYSANIDMTYVVMAIFGIVLMLFMRQLGIRNVWFYVFAGGLIWLATLKSGIHPTIAGVAMGLLAPTTALISKDKLIKLLDSINSQIKTNTTAELKIEYREILEKTEFTSREAISPLERIEVALHPWVAFLIMPIFALANAAVPINLNQLDNPLTLAAAIGLLFGKPIGIFISSYFLVKVKLAELPVNVNWRMMLGAGSLAGIGFTMSLFIASLSLSVDILNTAKSGIIVGSFFSACIGILLLSFRRSE